MTPETQKIVIQNLLSSNDLFAKCINIVSPEYFDSDIRPVVTFIHDYYKKYNSLPKVEYVNAEFDTQYIQKALDPSEIKFTADSVETFCQQQALYNAIIDSSADVTSGNKENYGKVLQRIQKALTISLQKELGIDMYEETEKRLLSCIDTMQYISTGIAELDKQLGGGLVRKQVTLFSANSGGGKSLMLSNLGANLSRQGYNVLQISLELSQEMIFLRNASILSGVRTKEWKEKIAEIAGTIKQHKSCGAGSFMIKRLAGGTCANDIRAYLKHYELEFNRKPDVLIIDYLDLMSPNGGSKNKGIFEQDKEKSEELAEIAVDYDCICLTASQQNREAIKTDRPDQSNIAGGISKINTVDNYISIYMNPEMRLKGELFLYYLKTRSSSAVGNLSSIAFNPDNLIISDTKVTSVSLIQAIANRRKTSSTVTLPGLTDDSELNIPEDFIEVVSRYHDEEDEIIRPAFADDTTDHSVIDVSDDEQLWDVAHKHKFVLKEETNHNAMIDLMQHLQQIG